MKFKLMASLILTTGCTLVPVPEDKCVPARVPGGAQVAPVASPRLDHHQHLLTPGARSATVDFVRALGMTSWALEVEREPLVDAKDLIEMLDTAGISRALVFSNAYYFSRHTLAEGPGEHERVMAENDWTLAQVRRYPDRLSAACSVNPLRSFAVAEIERCAASGGFKALKLHFDASGVDVANPAHVVAVRQAIATANRLRLPVVAHLQTETGYGASAARIFLSEILPAAADVPVTVAHLWGGGGYDSGAAAALAVFAEAMQRKDVHSGNLWFDVAQVSMAAGRDRSRAERDRAEFAERMRQIGFARLLYGSDGPQFTGVPPRQHWDEFRSCMPLTAQELDQLAGNVVPYLR